MVREALNAPAPENDKCDCYLIGLGAAARMENLILADALRKAGKNIALELEERSFKAQMRSANRSQAPLTLIRGESEMEKHIAIVKNMADGSQCEVADSEILNYLLDNIR